MKTFHVMEAQMSSVIQLNRWDEIMLVEQWRKLTIYIVQPVSLSTSETHIVYLLIQQRYFCMNLTRLISAERTASFRERTYVSLLACPAEIYECSIRNYVTWFLYPKAKIRKMFQKSWYIKCINPCLSSDMIIHWMYYKV